MHTLLSLGLSNTRQGYSVEAEENRRRSSSHPRTDDVTHQLSSPSALEGNARTDRCLSLFSLFSTASDCYAPGPDARACTCSSVCEAPWPPRCSCVRALIGGHNSRRRPIRASDSSRSSSGQSARRALSLSHVDCPACASTLFTTRPRRLFVAASSLTCIADTSRILD